MLFRFVRRHPLVLGAVFVAVALGTACDESTPPEEEPEVATLRLIVGPSAGPNDTVSVNVATGVVTGGPITISANTAIEAEFLRDDGSPDPLVTDADFRLDVTPENTSFVTFTRASAFAGTLNKVAAGSTRIEFGLFHLEEQHHEFERFVDITVN